jgi:hypothetical protein
MLCFPFMLRLSWFKNEIAKALGHAMAYTLFGALFHLLALTLITYFLMSASSRFQEISDVIGSNELVIIGLSALLYIVVLRVLNPLTSTTTAEIITTYRIERKLTPGFIQGAVLGSGVVLAFLISGLYKYVGFFVQSADAPLAMAGVALRIAILIVLVYCEEFVFRHKILSYLRRRMPDPYAVALTGALYCATKAAQFDLGLMHLLTLFFLSISLGFKSLHDGDFVRPAGFYAGLLIVFHPLLSLPILGNDFQGIVLIRYQSSESDSEISRLLTGGAGGPLASFALQMLLLFDVAQSIFKNRRVR